MLPSSRRVPHVLVVEDNPGDAILIQEAIRSFYSDAEVLVASDGEQAQRCLGEWKLTSAVVFLDLNVPRLDGFEILRQQQNGGWEVPIIILTSSSNPQDRIRSLKLGAKDYIEKPFDLARYFSTIHEALSKWVDVSSEAAC